MLPAARREDEAAAGTTAAAASEDDISCMQAHPHSESKLNAGTIAAAGCYVCQHIDLSRAHRSADADAYCVEDPSGCRG